MPGHLVRLWRLSAMRNTAIVEQHKTSVIHVRSTPELFQEKLSNTKYILRRPYVR